MNEENYKWNINKNIKKGSSNKDDLIVEQNKKYELIGEMLKENEGAKTVLIDFLQDKIQNCYDEVMPLLEKGEVDKAKNLSILVIAYEDMRKLLLASINYYNNKLK